MGERKRGERSGEEGGSGGAEEGEGKGGERDDHRLQQLHTLREFLPQGSPYHRSPLLWCTWFWPNSSASARRSIFARPTGTSSRTPPWLNQNATSY